MAARVKSDAVSKPRAMLNTTIDEEVLNEFKARCKELGIPMNLLIQSFMVQFSEGEFTLKIGKSNKPTIEFDNDKTS